MMINKFAAFTYQAAIIGFILMIAIGANAAEAQLILRVGVVFGIVVWLSRHWE